MILLPEVVMEGSNTKKDTVMNTELDKCQNSASVGKISKKMASILKKNKLNSKS